ncbi:MAG: 23S rRNA (guanosine(2251)-2'-O)-methyltransferase RlmB, partial [Filifactor alocis]|nr:23S rRNA (guanosine(2251)-2'-O)-methyltransferase RlmB [Filifactor alocis]
MLLILDEMEDPHNLGALIRSAECAGADAVIIPKRRAATVNTTVVKTSAGAVNYMKVARVTNLAQTMEELKKRNYWIYGLDMEGEVYHQVQMSGNIALVVGNEGRGLGRLVREKCDFILSIPMRGEINSLNASVAGSIVMFEASKQRERS